MEKPPSFEELEGQCRTHSRGQERKVLTTIEQLLNQYSVGFQEMGKFTRTGDNKLEQVWLLLTIRTFNSLLCAYRLLEGGYYSQSMILTRAAFEDWLTCEDCKTHQSTINAMLGEEKRVPSPKTMSDRLEEPLKQEWNEIYGLLSTFTHPRYSGVAVLLDPVTKLFRVGPNYDEKLFLVGSYYLLRALSKMTEFLIQLVNRGNPNWIVQAQQDIDQSLSCQQEVRKRANTLLKPSN